eukprot:TCALIF_08860-PA protein Name:"Protein of unknown function" AED:0.33 eAED:0.77 QI:83/0/0/1/0/0.5/2/0/80
MAFTEICTCVDPFRLEVFTDMAPDGADRSIPNTSQSKESHPFQNPSRSERMSNCNLCMTIPTALAEPAWFFSIPSKSLSP